MWKIEDIAIGDVIMWDRLSYTHVYKMCIGTWVTLSLEDSMCIHVYNSTYTYVIHQCVHFKPNTSNWLSLYP